MWALVILHIEHRESARNLPCSVQQILQIFICWFFFIISLCFSLCPNSYMGCMLLLLLIYYYYYYYDYNIGQVCVCVCCLAVCALKKFAHLVEHDTLIQYVHIESTINGCIRQLYSTFICLLSTVKSLL